MAKRQIFYSFHFDNDVMRVQMVRNIGALEQNEPVSTNEWETVKKGGEVAIKKWIDENMKNRSCVVVLVGSDTSNRQWVKYEIKKAWSEGKGVLGVYIHNLKCPRNGIGVKGANPFDSFLVGGVPMSTIVKCHEPKINDTYNDIKNNLESWIEEAIKSRN